MKEVLRSKRAVALPLAVAVGAVGCGGATKTVTERTGPVSAHTQAYAKPGPAVLLKGSKHRETAQFEVDTFSDYKIVTGYGPRLDQGETVTVDCLATGPVEAAPSAKGKWYHIRGPAQYAGYFAAANTFENGDTSGPLSSQPAVDPKVPACP